jgi:dihydroxyacid dehydratase/phosphogluconate dehydratase
MPLDSSDLMALISDWEDAGAEHVTLNFGPHDGFLERMLRFAEAFAAGYASIRATRAADSQTVNADAPSPAGAAIEDTITLRGNLAPLGAICRPVRNGMRWQRAQAKVFDSAAAATAAIRGGQVPPATVVVVRYQDSIAPGATATDLQQVMDAIVAANLGGSVSMLTDGRTDRYPQCLAVQSAMPGASISGPLAGLWDGDMICVDLHGGRIDVEYVDLKARLASASRPADAKASQRK